MKKYILRVFAVIGLFAAGVFLIFAISSISDKLKPDNQILYLPSLDEKAEPEHILKIFAWSNEMSSSGEETRVLRDLTGDKPAYVGALKEKTQLSELLPGDEYLGYSWFTNVKGDDSFFYDPVITFEYDGPIEVKYSVDIGSGWLEYGVSEKYMIKSSVTSGDATGRSNDSLTVRPNVSGLVGLSSSLGYCSEEMQQYNSYEKVNLLDVCPELPQRVDHCIGNKFVMHLFVKAYDKLSPEKVNASADIRITYFTGGGANESLDYKKLIENGFGNYLDTYELYHFIRLDIVDYTQIETSK